MRHKVYSGLTRNGKDYGQTKPYNADKLCDDNESQKISKEVNVGNMGH
jgi:hypothetical protein